MKKLISVLLTVAMLFGTFAATVTAASDICIRLADTSGSAGYSAGSDAVNTWVAANGGGTLIFDVYVEAVNSAPSGKTSRIVAFTGDSPYNYAGYSFTDGAFIAGAGSDWPTSSHTSTFDCYSSNKYDWTIGQWYEMAIQFNGNVAVVYLDGIPMVSAEVDSSFETQYLILYPQYCTIKLDNLRVCSGDYDVRNRVGTVYAATDFTGVSSASDVTDWYFSDTYTASSSGRPMPGLDELVPERTVSPEVTGAYLKYSEAGGSGIAVTAKDFTDYNGFTVVQDIRFDRKSVSGCFGVRFGTNYIAGYDWDSASFVISQRAGYGFSTDSTYIYAKTAYALTLKETYEIAVRQDGSTVSVYLNGVLVAQATNDAFATGYGKVDIDCYRIGASIDNLVIAYPDYNVREAEGNAAARFTFDESVDYINGIWDFALDGSNGYSIAQTTGAAALTVSDAEAAEGAATVGISVANLPDATGFELSVAYPEDMTVAMATVAGGLGGTSAMSQSTANPFVLTHVAADGSTVSSASVLNVTFNTPSVYGDYEITATLIPYMGDVVGAPITGTGTVTVPEPGINVGLPDGVAYDGETFTWNAAEGAAAYELYMMYEGDEYEYMIDYIEGTEYYFPCDDWIPDPGVYIFKVYMYDENYEMTSVSSNFAVIREEDGSVYGGLPAYAQELYNRLVALAEGPYSTENQATVDQILANAKTALSSAGNYNLIVSVYDDYAAQIAEVPVKVEIPVGVPDGLAYDGETLSWNAADGAASYDIYMLYENDDYEYLVDNTEASEYSLPATDLFTDAGLYFFRVYMYDSSDAVTGVSEDLTVIVEADGNVITGGLAEYAEVLLARLSDSVAENTYSADDQALIDGYLADAATELPAAADYAEMMETYESYETLLAEVPVASDNIKGDVNGDGAVNNSDYIVLVRVVAGVSVSYNGNPDVNRDGLVSNVDVSALLTIIS